MRCTNKILALPIILSVILSGCGSTDYALQYSLDSTDYSEKLEKTATTFASEICVAGSDIGDTVDLSERSCCGLFDLSKRETLYAHNVHTQLDPASLTKVMTAIIALKYGSLDQNLIAKDNVRITEDGAQVINLSAGDSMTLEQALHLLLIYSANDVAVLIADNIGGSVEEFVNLMNQEAVAIGATNTHFMNPNGLTADDHYTTAYDMYLMFNEAMNYDKFSEIIRMSNYTTQYYTSSGDLREISVNNTNGYISGKYEMPAGITVLGGKTGTTNAAGHCLIQLAADTSGNEYIAVIMRAEDTQTLYREMSEMLLGITS